MFIVDCDSDGNAGVAVVVIGNNGNFGYSSSFRKFDVDFDRAARFLTPARVELIDKRSIFGLDSTTFR